MKTLAELLSNRSGKDLFLMTLRRELPLPGEWSEEEIDEIFNLYHDPREEDYCRRFLEDWEDDQFEPFDEPKDEEEARLIAHQKAFGERCLRLGRRLRSIDEGRKEYAKILAKDLLKPENIQHLFLNLKDSCAQTIRDICDGTIKAEGDYYPITVNPDKNWHYGIFEAWGYGLIRKTDPYDEEDDREHYTGICLSDDFLSLIKQADTKETEEKRSLNNMLDSLQRVIEDYYEAAPIEIVHQIYSILREEAPDRYPALNETELDQAIVDYWGGPIGKLYDMITYRGKRYLYNTTQAEEDEITDESTPEDSYVVALFENWEERNIEPYIPQLAEMQNYLEYEYWEARKPFRDLHQLIVEFYMDEQSMEEMGGSIMMFGMDPEEREEYRRRRHYSMDRVMENAEEKFIELLHQIWFGTDPGQLYRQQKNFTCWLNDSSKRKFRRLLTKCSECVPVPWLLGNTRKSQST